MSKDDDFPNWEHLPGDPIRFFELKEGFQRNDLKRSYTRLIKLFKPEKHPEEFQRIRQAYEQLDQHLRYGTGAINRGGLQRDGQITFPNAEFPQQRIPQRGVPAEALLSKIVNAVDAQAIDDVYASVANQESKSAQEYVALALLSDLVNGTERREFINWLVKGIVEHPGHQGLLRLCEASFRAKVSLGDAPKILKHLAQAIGKEPFFVVTEPLWHQLSSQMPFGEFAALLQECDVLIRDMRFDVRTIFLLGILRANVFRASRDWIVEIARKIEENYEVLPEYVQMDLEVTMALARYCIDSDVFNNRAGLRTQIHQMMATYCENEAQGCREIVDFQVSRAGNWSDFAEAFPLDGVKHDAALDAWLWVCADVCQKMQIPSKQAIRRQLWSILEKKMLIANQRDFAAVRSTRAIGCLRIIFLAMTVFLGVFSGLFVSVLFEEMFEDPGNAILGGCTLGFLAGLAAYGL